MTSVSKFSLLPGVLLLSALAILSGCAPTPERGERFEAALLDAETIEQLELADMALEQQEFLAAAEIYSDLAERHSPPTSYRYRLGAAQALYLAGDDATSQALLATLDYVQLDPELRLRRQFLAARLALASDAEKALELLRDPASQEYQITETALLAEFHQLKGKVFATLGNHLEAAREYILSEFYLQQEAALEANQQQILAALSQLSGTALQRLRIHPPPDLLSGWIDLSLLARQPDQSPGELQQQLALWHQDYPQHPALASVIENLATSREQLQQIPGNIALLLPLSGRYAKVAEAVQDGFLAAYYNSPQRNQQNIQIYDVGESPYQTLVSYRQALWDGAEFVVGPLTREAVNYLASQDELPVPTLTLNYPTENAESGIFQIALSPEDDAAQVAEMARQNGLNHAAMLVPNSDLGRRIADSFEARWTELGGTISETIRYNDRNSDYSSSIKALLDIDKSENRKRRLASTIGKKFEFTPRRRQDIDMIFLMAQPRQARLIKPQLTFHHGGNLPIYATSHIFSGEIDSNKDRDMDDILFVDIPWTINPAGAQAGVKRSSEALLHHHRGQLQRLVALGVDAYQLITRLKLLEQYPSESLQGESGELRMGENRHIHRQLSLAQFHRGKPRLVVVETERAPGEP